MSSVGLLVTADGGPSVRDDAGGARAPGSGRVSFTGKRTGTVIAAARWMEAPWLHTDTFFILQGEERKIPYRDAHSAV